MNTAARKDKPLSGEHLSGATETEAIKRFRRAEEALWEQLGVAPREQFLNLTGLNLRVRVQVVGEGDPVLFVHGGPNAGSTWAPLAALLQDFKCIILDRPGCGLSEACDYQSAPLQSVAVNVLSAVLDALGLQQANIICNSVGGSWGLWLAHAYPDRIVRIVQYSCPAFMPGMVWPIFLRLLSVPGLNRFFTRLQKPSVESTKMIYHQMGHGVSLEAGRIPEAFFEWSAALMAETDTMVNELGMIEAALTWRGPRPGMEFGFEDLRQVTQPTSFLWGESDAFGGITLARRLVEAIPGAALEVLPDGGHLPWLDDPQQAARHARDFLRMSSTE